ncbi:MAG: zinc-ribbon domain-containing protein [Nitrosospira sp.]|nr:zinc-ribbon domain-containing protein [Nitrosospira sp.]
MALVTRCPDCATAFRVTPLHLQARGGDVRCGRCGRIFNGFAMLGTTQELEVTAPPRPKAGETPGTEEAERTPGTLSDDFVGPAQPEQEELTPSHFDESVEDETIAEAVEQEQLASEPAVAKEPIVVEPVFQEAVAEEQEVWHRPSEISPTPASAHEEERPGLEWDAAAHRQEDFMEEDHSRQTADFQKSRRRWGSLAWAFGSLLLVFALGAQASYLYRAELAAMVPDARPYLERYCELLECTIPEPRQTKLLNIESSDMEVDTQQPGIFTLSATVRNHASYPQPFPSFQLTLIDSGDRPLASRTFPPQAYLEENVHRAGAIAAHDEINIKLYLDSGDLNAAGYRLLLLYPNS